jgi:hypothetical protein
MAEMDRAVAEFVRSHRRNLDAQLLSADGPRALLRARMAEMAQKPARSAWQWTPRFTLFARAVALGAGVLAATVAGVVFVGHAGGTRTDARAVAPEPGALPERKLTPGATRMVTISEVCSVAHEEVVRAVPVSTRNAVFAEYGLNNAQPDDYEIDYLIAPGLGGTEDIHNLWPQPFRSATWNARVKDALEERLHAMVCAGDLDLPTAQREISTDWIAAYKKYFHTNAPMGERAGAEESAAPVQSAALIASMLAQSRAAMMLPGDRFALRP